MSQSHSEPYCYTALSGNDSIRLISISPGTKDSSLFGEIFTVSLANKVEYLALSYAWQGLDTTYALHTAQGQIAITPSLYSALRHIRHLKNSIVLWADAVCINQSDNAEKSHQVGIMARIYREAMRVTVYLGDEANESQTGFNLIHVLSDFCECQDSSQSTQTIQPKDFQSHGLPDVEDKGWEAIRAILRRPWFRRVWIIQELLLGREVTISCGDSTMPWKIFSEAIVKWDKHNTGTMDHGSGYDRGRGQSTADGLKAVDYLSRAAGLKEEQPLIDLLTTFRYTAATRARDHLFALIGLAKDGQNPSFYPDYNEPFEHVVTRYAHEFIRGGHGLQLIATAGLSADGSPFPSWVPDWTTDRLKMNPLNLGTSQHRAIYKACGDTELQLRPTQDPNVLGVQGGIIDTVKEVGSSHFEQPGTSSLQPLYDRLLEADIMLERMDTYLDGSVQEAYWRTLIRNRTRDLIEAPPEYALLYPKARIFIERKHKNIANEEDEKTFPVVWPFLAALIGPFEKMRFGVTAKGYMGLFHETVRAGDHVAIFLGCIAPVILRKGDDREGHYRLVGESYVHGVMKGEAIEMQGFMQTELYLW